MVAVVVSVINHATLLVALISRVVAAGSTSRNKELINYFFAHFKKMGGGSSSCLRQSYHQYLGHE